MTDLPVMNPEPKSWWLAVHESRGTCVLHRRAATLEDVRQVLDAAGYVVVEKTKRVEQSGVEYRTAVEALTSWQREPNLSVAIDDLRHMCAEAIGAHKDLAPGLDACIMAVCAHVRSLRAEIAELKTSGAPAAALVDSEEGGVAPRPAGGREEPGTIHGATVGAAKLHEQVRDLAAKVVALDQIARDSITGHRAVGHGCAADVLQERLDALK